MGFGHGILLSNNTLTNNTTYHASIFILKRGGRGQRVGGAGGVRVTAVWFDSGANHTPYPTQTKMEGGVYISI